MKEIYTLLLLILIIAILIAGQKAKKKNSELAKALIRLTYVMTISVIASVSAIIIPVEFEEVALFMQTLHYASTEWMLIFLMAFFECYVEGFEGKTSAKVLIFGVSGFSSVQLLLNAVFHHVVYCEYVEAGGITYRIFKNIYPWYQIHEYFSYFLAFIALLALVGGAVKATSFYRGKYLPAAIAFAITLLLEAICTMRNSLLDYALFGYLGLGIFLIYFSIYHVNNSLITSTLSFVTSDSQGGVVCFDISGKCVYANNLIKELYGVDSDISKFEDIFSKYEYGRYKTESTWTEKFELEKGERFFEITYGKMETAKEYNGCYFYLYDRTKDVLSIKEAEYRAEHDALTGLSNKKAFNEQVQEIRESYNEVLYVIAADIKDFKLINDLFGHDKGDDILKAFATAMQNSMPEYAACCRRNSDRFCFCVAKKDFSEKKILDNLRAAEKILADEAFQLIAHFGVYEIQPNDDDVDVMYDYARMSIHAVKDEYNKFFAYFDSKMMDKVLREKQLVAEFDKALAEKQFLMYLQPQVKPDGTVIGAEALVRWKHPTFGMISPGEFISTFERVGLIHKLDQYIWECAAQKLKEWQGTDRNDYHISVNISTKDFYHIDIYKTVIDIVEKYGINPEKLKLEITESAFMNDQEKQLELIANLQAYGFHLEIDDFGSGYSSLNILKDMKADVLKIDMGFLRQTAEEERSKLILNNIVLLAKDLKMLVVSEGVEKKEQVDYLTNTGCDIFQGYYFDRPIAVEEFETKY